MTDRDIQIRKGQAFNLAVANAEDKGDKVEILKKYRLYFNLLSVVQSTDDINEVISKFEAK